MIDLLSDTNKLLTSREENSGQLTAYNYSTQGKN